MAQTPVQGLLFRQEPCGGGPPARELEPIAIHRLGLDIGDSDQEGH
jgi:hypothetical protein